MGRNRENKGVQQGAQKHAANQQGPKTRSKQAKIAHTPNPGREEGPRYNPDEIKAHDTTGKDRLFEGREQHDDADKSSEKTRLLRDKERHGHD